MDLADKKIAVLGGTLISCEIVKAAHALGMHVTTIDYNPPEQSPAKRISDEHACISVADTGAVARYLAQQEIDGVITGYSDSILGFYADICDKANLPCYGTRAQFEMFTNKHSWKALCCAHGVPTAVEFDESLLATSEEEIPFPLMLKPVDGSGSRGVTIVRSKAELVEGWERSKIWSKTGSVIAEQYLEGPECTVFWLFINGEYFVSMLGNRHVKDSQPGYLPLPVGYSYPASVLPRYLCDVAPRVREMLRACDVQNGMMFMQCVVQDGLPYVYDIGYRLTGSLEHHNQKVSAGYSSMDMLLNYAVKGRMTDDLDIETKIKTGLYAPSYNISLLMKPGTIDHFEGIESALQRESVIACVKAHIEGETLPSEAKGQLCQIALRVLGNVRSPNDLPAEMLVVQSILDIKDINNKSLLFTGLEKKDFENKILDY